MGEENKVTLYGMWASPFVKRVEIALKIKGIPYEYVEEDLRNKSQLLLQYNPVHKKVPVLVHNGKPIAESLVILEYIEETWKNGPKILPEDPYERAKVRFWASFIHHQQLFDSMVSAAKSSGEAHEKAMKEAFEKLTVFEEGMKDFFPSGTPHFEDENIGFLDIVLCSLFGAHKAQEEAHGLKIIDPERHPLVYSWVTALNEVPAVKESLPPHDKMVALIQFLRRNAPH
ncbi:hypothetical protein AAG906_000581 [Vitis piasezkii]